MTLFVECSSCGKAMTPEKAMAKVIEPQLISRMSEKDVAEFHKNYVYCQICFSIKYKDNIDPSMRTYVISVDESAIKKSRRSKAKDRNKRSVQRYGTGTNVQNRGIKRVRKTSNNGNTGEYSNIRTPSSSVNNDKSEPE